MAGYRDTLNLPRTDFPMKAELTRREPERLAWWKDRDAYGRLRSARRGAPVWILHDGPPYSNNHLHMGTAANKIWKDAAVRAASIRGCDAPYVPGWDNHGMPIEIEVGREFREQKVQPDRLALRKRCRTYAEEWVAIQRDEFVRLGVWGEWENPYLTMAHGFEAAIVEAFATLAARGFVQRGLRSIHWCPTDRTALAEAEIEYEDDPSPSIHVLFPIEQNPSALAKWQLPPDLHAIAWTTTPWTLPANLGLMVDPGAEYAIVVADGRRFLVAAARVEAVAAAAGWTRVVVERRLGGRQLLNVRFVGPWGHASRVVDGTPYVSMEDGTGLVHMAPGHGKEDFAVGQRNALLSPPASTHDLLKVALETPNPEDPMGTPRSILCPVDEGGRFMAGAEPFVGRSVLEVNDDIIAWLRERGRLLAASTIRHSYPHCWRCRRPVIFRATDQWFMIIDHDGHRDRALEAIDAVRWDPAGSRNRIRESVRGRPDWCLSRQRSWGVGIPAVYCEACGEPDLHPDVMRRAAELTRAHGSDAWYERPVEEFLPPDFTCRRCGAAGPFRKETDILDVWFDSGCTHRAVRSTHPSLDDAWSRAERAGGAIVYFEGPDQHRGWFNSSLMVGVGITRRPPYTDVLTHGWVLDATGRAMHKSLGNVISPLDIVAKVGADVTRWWALATDWRSDVRVGDEILQRVSEAYRKVRNTFRFLLGNLSDFDPAAHALPAERLTPVDRAFLEHLEHRFTSIREAWDGHVFHRAMDALLDLCTVDLSAVFLDVTKDRLYTLQPEHPERRSAQTVLWRALRELATAASPALVFTAEEVWQHHPALLAECPSVHESQWTATSRRAAEPATWAALLELRDAVNARLEPMRAAKEIAVTGEAEVTVRLPADLRARIASCADDLAGFLLVAAVHLEPAPAGTELSVEAAKTAWARCDRCWTYREDVGRAGAPEGLCGRCVAALAARADDTPRA